MHFQAHLRFYTAPVTLLRALPLLHEVPVTLLRALPITLHQALPETLAHIPSSSPLLVATAGRF